MKNNNEKIIFNLSLRYLSSNKVKFLVISLSIILTTVLFITVLTLASGMKESFELQSMRQVGTTAHGTVKYLTTEEKNRLYGKDYVKEYGETVIIGECINEELKKRNTEIRYVDENYSTWGFLKPKIGRLPIKKSEIAVDSIIINMLNIQPEIGSKVNIKFGLNGSVINEEFEICGIYEGDKFSSASEILVSEEYLNQFLSSIDQGFNKKNNIYQGLYFVDVKFYSNRNIEDSMYKLVSDSGFDSTKTSIGVNWGYLNSGVDESVSYYIPLGIVLALITFTGYMIIHNIFSIFVVKDIKSYSLLKTIGTTDRQIRNIIIIQVMIISLISIPIGIAVGYGIGNILLPYFLSTLNTNYMKITFNPIIYVFGTLISIFTVILSSLKPARTAAKTTPIEGLTYHDSTMFNVSKITYDGKLYRMALLNIQRNKGKIISVVISISLSLALLCNLYMILSGFDKEKYISHMVISDFQFAKNDYYSFGVEDKSIDISREYIDMIENFEGFEKGGGVYYKSTNHRLEADKLEYFQKLHKDNERYNTDPDYINMIDYYIENEIIPTQLYGIDSYVYDKVDIIEGEFDGDKFASGDYIILYSYDNEVKENIYKIGDKIDIDLSDGNVKEYEVMAIGNLKNNISIKYFIDSSIIAIIPSSEINNRREFELINYIFDISDQYEDQIDLKLNQFVNGIDDNYNYKSKRVYDKEFQNTTKSYWLVGGALITITAVIGILNFINITFTSIESRKYEFAIMRSIGMTKKQLRHMLILEGIIIALISIILGLLITLVVAYGLVHTIIREIWFYTFRFNLYPIAFLIIPLLLVASIIPLISYRSLGDNGTTQLIRETIS